MLIYMNFMLIRMFFMYFADFWANFYDFFYYCFVLLPQMGTEKTPITWAVFSKHGVTVLLILSTFLLRNMTKNGDKWKYFWNFFAVFRFFLFFRQVFFDLLWLAYCFASIWIPYWLKSFCLGLYSFVILRNKLTFSCFLVKVVCESLFFHNLPSSVFLKKVVLVDTSRVDEVTVAEIVISGSQFMTEFDQIFYHILIDLFF